MGRFVAKGGRDAASGGAAFLFAEAVAAVVLPREVEEAVGEVAHHGALIDKEPGKGFVTGGVDVGAFPEELAGVGGDTAADRELVDLGAHDASGDEVEFESSYRMAAIGASIYFGNGGYLFACVGEFLNHFWDEATFAFVTKADAGIEDELTAKGRERHETNLVCYKRKKCASIGRTHLRYERVP